MPKPNPGEEKKAYLSRCMSEYADKYPDEAQRYAVCNSLWKTESGTDEEKAHAKKLLEVFTWNEEDHPRHPEGGSDGGKFAPKNVKKTKSSDDPDTKGDLKKENAPNRINRARDPWKDEDLTRDGIPKSVEDEYTQTVELGKDAEAVELVIDALNRTDDGEMQDKAMALSAALDEWVGAEGDDAALADWRIAQGGYDDVLELTESYMEELGQYLKKLRGQHAGAGPSNTHTWNEGDHPRHPKGDGDGGKFAPKSGGSSNASFGGLSDEQKSYVEKTIARLEADAKKYKEPKSLNDLARLQDGLRVWLDGDKDAWDNNYGQGWDSPVDMAKSFNEDLDLSDSVRKTKSKKKHGRVEVLSRGSNGPRERFSTAFKIDAKEEGVLSGVASMFGSMVETYPPTRVQKGAFLKTLSNSEQLRRVKLLYQHNTDWPIGKPIELKEVSNGLNIKAAISKTSIGNDVLTLVRDGVLDEMSIGFDPVSWRMVKEEGFADQVRYLDEVHLWEISVVTFAADSRARIQSLHSALPFQDLPLADIDHHWNPEAAVERVRQLTKGGESQFRRAFLWTNGSVSRFPIADVVDGVLKAVPRGIFWSAARVGTLDNPEERKLVQEHLARYYKKLDRTPPWVASEFEVLRSTAEWLASLPATASFGRQAKALVRIAKEIRANAHNKPLTARSRQAVTEMIAEFQSLLRPVEPTLNGAATDRQRQDAAIAQKLRELNLVALEAGIL